MGDANGVLHIEVVIVRIAVDLNAIVERVEDKFIYTIEGNTNDTGSREGYEVCRRVRAVNMVLGYLRY